MTDAFEYARKTREGLQDAEQSLEKLQVRIAVENDKLKPSPRVTEHLLHGAGRRIRVMRRALENIFTLFPPEMKLSLPVETVLDAQINLHAFLINAYATNDNWAWAFVLRHDLIARIPRKTDIGLFHQQTMRHLPAALSGYLQSDDLTRWRVEYAKMFRDATSHRIPPYIPPFVLLDAEKARHDELAEQKRRAMEAENWALAEGVEEAMRALCRPSLLFFNSLGADEPNKGLYLHAQVVADAMTVAEIGEKFLDHWHACAEPAAWKAAPI